MMVVSLFDSLVDALHEPMSRDVILLKPPFFIPILAVLVVCSVTAFIQSGFRFISPSSVDLEYRDIEQIPQDVLNNRRLRTLNLARNKLTNVPKCLSQTLERMHLGWNNLNEFPEDLLQCHQLNWLHIAVNPIRTIPEEIGTLTKLTVLCVCSCELRKIPSAIFKLQKLLYLDISHNCLKEFPKGVLKLASLERLDINDNKIIKIPAEIEKLVNLKVLRIHKNKLTKPLPQNLAKLVSLLELNVSNCNLANIPEFIPENLSNLTTLDIRYNRIVKLPLNFHKLTKLKCFVFVKNPLKNPPIEVCAMGLKAIRLYQEDAEKFSSVHVTRQQVMVVGEKSVGKTSLCRTLKARKPELASRDDRTIVLEETVLQELEAGVELRFTDFGGQRLYKVLHPIFLRINALVLVLFNLELYETNCEHYFKSVGFWLRKIQAKTPGVTIIPVGTKGDTVTKKKAKAKTKHVFDHAKNYVKIYRKNLEKRLEEERKKLQTIVQTDPSGTRGGSELLANIKKGIERLERMQESILNVQKPVIISSKEFHGVDELKKRILQVAETKSCALPENWYQFAKLIAERAKEDDAMYMPYAEAKELWDQATPSKKSAPTMLESIKVLLTSPMHGKFNEEDCEKFETVLTFLHRWGAILWYVSPRLKDYIFHNPKKLTNFFKAVFDHDMETTLAAKRRRRGFPEYTDVKFEEEMSWFKKKGLLTKKLLQGILAADFQGVDLDTMFSLLQHFDLCYEVQCKEQPTLYFPWFLFQSLPDDVQQLWPKTMESGVLQLTVEFHFITVVPPSLFERIQVIRKVVSP
ncbi:malignant fibrous histiocytoma-amplified sequence 1 homolog [Lingula anatina]|uniref:Malignant fibrous histiocytoma-amplified sequence 1 homolog n=1 Tax=Lingula anatina TaxID=7574 RepID=A0A1S3JBV3_LINAN|nr:malignant fibrous histiocytoma-amplified sequence 1 homolog [Lingula anatina]|eukprot:XP_013407803.1 malignant fibrous histiocytoma-amplified sequence 1 homolog [Lingula anatina]